MQAQNPQQSFQMNKETLLQAIQIFMNPNQENAIEQFKQAESYLIAFERSKEAWAIICELLLSDGLQLNAYGILCKKLKSKLEFDFGQLEEKDRLVIQGKVIEIIQKHKATSEKVIRSQLSLCFIYCYIHNFKSFPDIIDLMKKFMSSDPLFFAYIIQILQYLPSEINSETLVIDNEQLTLVEEYFKSDLQMKIVLELDQIGRSANLTQQQQYQLLHCFNDWINLGYSVDVVNAILDHSLFQLSLSTLETPELREDSANIIVSILSQINLKNSKHQEFMKKFAGNTEEYFKKYNEQLHQENEEEALQYLKIISQFGRTIMDELISNLNQYSISFFNSFLTLSKDSFSDNSRYITDFWVYFIKRVIVSPNKA